MCSSTPLPLLRGGESSRSQLEQSARALISSIEKHHPSYATPASSQSPDSPAPAPASLFHVPQSTRSATGELERKADKIAIPRLDRSVNATRDNAIRSKGKERVSHACEPCRNRKTKCSGKRPVCRHCQDFKITCVYADGKRDSTKKQFVTMTEKVLDYERLLKDLSIRVSDTDAKVIRASLAKQKRYNAEDAARENTADVARIPTLDAEPEEPQSRAQSRVESEASAGAGSTGALDQTDEDFTREQARATGFMGKTSEIAWLQRLRKEIKYGDRQQDESNHAMHERTESGSWTSFAPKRSVGDMLIEVGEGFAANDLSYHLDDLPINTCGAVDPYAMPAAEVANHLFNAYMERVHASFPVVGRLNLTSQFRRFVSGMLSRPPDNWLAIINLIFAIGGKYSQLLNTEGKEDQRDLIYFTRARLLSMNSETLFQHPDLQQIQILGLMSFYMLCTSQVNRAWILSGIAIREAGALGMNMRNDSSNLKDSLKEIRYRMWWALYSLERRLCSMTGRVSCILDEHCTTPLPIPLEEEQFETEQGQKLLAKERQQGDRAPSSNPQTPSIVGSTPSTDRSRSRTQIGSRSPSVHSNMGHMEWAKDILPNSSLYFLHLVQLTRVTQNVSQRLYNPASMNGTWSEVQTKIKELDEQLQYWYQNVPQEFAFRTKQRGRGLYEARLSLGFFYYSAKMIVHRPCLCRLDRKIPNQSTDSLQFDHNSAAACVEAAMEMLELIPDEPNAVGLIRVGPWWNILHCLVQAITVLMLEITFHTHDMPEEVGTIFESSKKGIRWLHALGEANVSAKRAWAICLPMLHEAARKINRDVSDLPQNPPGAASPPAEDTSTQEFINTFAGNTYQDESNQNSHINSGVTGQPTSQIFDMYDLIMHYDEYYPADLQMNEASHYVQPVDAEMEFMTDAYHHDQQLQEGKRHRSQNYQLSPTLKKQRKIPQLQTDDLSESFT